MPLPLFIVFHLIKKIFQMENHLLKFAMFFFFAHTCCAQIVADRFFSGDKSKIVPSISIEKITNQKVSYDLLPKFAFSANANIWIQSISGSTALPMELQGQTSKSPVAKISHNFVDGLKYLKYGVAFTGLLQVKKIAFVYGLDYVQFKYSCYVPENSGYKDASIKSTLFSADLCLAYDAKLKRQKVSNAIYAGTRIWSTDNTLDFTEKTKPQLNVSYSKTWVDPIVGVYTLYEFSEKLFAYLKAEVGGYGLSSKISYLLQGSTVIRITKHLNAMAGLKLLSVNYDKNDFLWKISQSGLLLSLGYRFESNR